MKARMKRLVALILVFAVLALEPLMSAEAATKTPAPSVTKKTMYIGTKNSSTTYTIKINNLTTGTVKYTSSDKKVAKVNTKGVITAVSAGKATIEVQIKQGGKTYKSTIAVTVRSPYVKITDSVKTLTVGDSYKFVGKVYGFKTYTKNWSVSNTKIAKINASTGKLTAVAPGTVKVYFKEKESGKYKSCTVQVVAKPAATPTPKPTATPKPTTAPKPTATPVPTQVELEENEDFEYDVVDGKAILLQVKDTTQTAVVIPNKIGGYPVAEIDDSAFEGMSDLTSVKIPSTVTRIGDSAFGYCDSLKSITLPSGLTELGENAFEACASLVSITIPKGVETLGEGTFAECTSLKKVTLNTGLVEIEEEAFLNCEALESITIPNTVTLIGDSALKGCVALKTVTFATGGKEEMEIGSEAFLGCTALANLTIGSRVTEMGDSVFEDCTSLKTVKFSGSLLTEISDSAFAECKALTSITLPSKLESIGSSAFEGCTSLKSLKIPSTVEDIASGAFDDCPSLKLQVKKDSAAHEFAVDEELGYTTY